MSNNIALTISEIDVLEHALDDYLIKQELELKKMQDSLIFGKPKTENEMVNFKIEMNMQEYYIEKVKKLRKYLCGGGLDAIQKERN